MPDWSVVPEETELEQIDRCYYKTLDVARNYKSRIILTRRTLISVISFMARKIYYSPKENSTFNIEKSTSYIIKEALIENYVLKAQDETDKEKIMDTIEMNGILGLDIRIDTSSSSASDNKKTLITL